MCLNSKNVATGSDMRRRQVPDHIQHGRFPANMWAVMLGLICGIWGCGTGRTAMQIDSDSRSPFLSWQVPIAGQSGKARIETTAGVRGEAPVEQLKFEPQQPRKSASSWTGWFQKLRPPMTIPLPRTDIDDDGEIIDGPQSSTSTIGDF